VADKKTIIILLSHFTPGVKVGGPLTSVKSIIKYLGEDFRFKIVTYDRDFGDNSPYPNIITHKWINVDQVDVYYIPKTQTRFKSLYFILNHTEYDYIYSPSLFDPLFSVYILILRKLKLFQGKVILAPKGELFDEALAFKPIKKIIFLKIVNFLRIFDDITWHATDEKEKISIEKHIKTNSKNVRIANLLSPAFRRKKLNEIPLENNILKIVFLARISKDKNLPFVFDVLRELDIPLQFDLYGPIEDTDIWEKCQEKIKNLPKKIKVNYLGILKSNLVSDTIATYDLFFLPTFAENFGHSIAESISLGTPVLISDNTPWRNLEIKKWGWDISLTQKEKFLEAINTVNTLTTNERWQWRKSIMNSFNNSFSLDLIVKQNKELFK
jgi:glycosyltransferase involved in cell wall biosynthesis